MKPIRARRLSVLKELRIMEYPVYLEVAKHALQEESFKVTKIIHYYGKRNLLEDAENFLILTKQRGFIYDQVILTTLVHMYSKTDRHDQAKEYYEDIKLLGEPLDKRSYGSTIMASIRDRMPEEGENLL